MTDQGGHSQIKVLQEKLHKTEGLLTRYRTELQKAQKVLEKTQLELLEQIEVLNKLHKFLVPTTFGDFPGFDVSLKYLPGFESTTGDYIDFQISKNKKECLGVLASHKGTVLSIVFMTSILKMAQHVEETGELHLTHWLQQILEDYKERELKPERSSLCFFKIDRRTLKVEVAAWQNIYGYFWQSRTHHIEAFEGAKEKGSFLDATYQLMAGDLFIVLSHGFLEAFGDQAIMDKEVQEIFMSSTSEVHEMRNELIVRAKKAQKERGSAFKNDLSLTVIKAQDSILHLAQG